MLYLPSSVPKVVEKQIRDNEKKHRNLETKPLRVCVLTCPLGKHPGSHVLIANLTKILEPITERIHVITGNFPKDAVLGEKIHVISTKYWTQGKPVLLRIPQYIMFHLRTSYYLAKISSSIDMVVFYIGTDDFILPILLAKMLRKKVVMIATGSIVQSARYTYSGSLFGLGGIILPSIFGILRSIVHLLSDRIVIYTQSSIIDEGLTRHRKKLAYGARYIDLDHFKVNRKLAEREKIIGYIARFERAKGVVNFVRAIPLISRERTDVEFLMGGYGELWDEVRGELATNRYNDRVKLIGWVPHEEVPEYLNKLRLFVFPTYSEGLPPVVLEAMACGTPVLATAVGSIPDLIKEGETGFILEDNSPSSIAQGVIRALNHTHLNEIVANARKLVLKEFTYEAAVERYRRILYDWE